ncbi:MAG TPA: LemA family protein [Nannocystaceae bacterium]|nr:LemA family protein [Nannocystaceae bacterium]
MKRSALIGLVAGLVLVFIVWAVSSYNALVGLDQDVAAQWGQVENVYQRRADLVPNLVASVKGAAKHERETLEAVTQARAKTGQTSVVAPYDDPKALARFQASQDQLSSALSRLMIVAEQYPDLKANENFLALQSQLEGTENRIAVERKRYNDVARDFNTRRNRFPTVLVAGMFGDRFPSKAYFEAQAGAEQAPSVEF